jgi:hypothetical protein
MDEIELLRRFRADQAAPSARDVETARAALMTAIERESDRGSDLARHRRARPLHRPWAAAVVAGATALATAAVLVITLSSGPGGTPSAAARVLHRVAAVAAGRPAQAPPRRGQYVYTKSREAYQSIHPAAGGLRSVLVPEIRQIWIAPDGAGRLREVTGRPLPLSAADRSAPPAVGSPGVGRRRVSDHSYPAGAGGLSYLNLSHLPTDPDALRQLIEERKVEGGPPGDAETFTIIGDLLRETYAPPRLRAALYEIASELPGVELRGTVRDEVGREGVGVAYVDRGLRHELIFDSKTSALLGERDVVVDPATAFADYGGHVPPVGAVVGYASYLASGVVNSTSARAHGLPG